MQAHAKNLFNSLKQDVQNIVTAALEDASVPSRDLPYQVAKVCCSTSTRKPSPVTVARLSLTSARSHLSHAASWSNIQEVYVFNAVLSIIWLWQGACL
jgi:hypothetical protein